MAKSGQPDDLSCSLIISKFGINHENSFEIYEENKEPF
jgi:hypothetical protein